jgi:NADH-quinone oxidoreductase subunit H
MLLVSAVAVTLFLGGWLRPFSSVSALDFLDFVPVVVLGLASAWCLRAVLRLPTGIEWRWQRLMMWALALAAVQGIFWFMAKVLVFLFGFIWFRGTFPRYRFDQLMSLGWRFMIPLAIVNVIFCGIGLILSRQQGWSLAGSLWLGTAATLLVAVLLSGRRKA